MSISQPKSGDKAEQEITELRTSDLFPQIQKTEVTDVTIWLDITMLVLVTTRDCVRLGYSLSDTLATHLSLWKFATSKNIKFLLNHIMYPWIVEWILYNLIPSCNSGKYTQVYTLSHVVWYGQATFQTRLNNWFLEIAHVYDKSFSLAISTYLH